MKHAIKKQGKTVRAWCLGEGSAMEKKLLEEGVIRLHSSGIYELFSQEAVSGKGETAAAGDFFKVDVKETGNFPYPNSREYFLANHRHIDNDIYEQLPKPVGIWQIGDDICDTIEFLLHSGRLTLCPDTPEAYFNAFLWGAPLSAPQDSTLVFYNITRSKQGEIVDVDFNFVRRTEFERDYKIL